MRTFLVFFVVAFVLTIIYKSIDFSSSKTVQTIAMESEENLDTFVSQIEEEEHQHLHTFKNVDFYSDNVIEFEVLQNIEPQKVQIVDLVGDEELNYFLENASSYNNLEVFQLVNASITKAKFESLIDALKNKQHFKKLRLFHCKVKEIPNSIEALTKLEVLDLSMNNLAEMSESITKLKHLRWIRFYNNRQFVTLHEDLGQLTKLEHLDVAGTRLTTFPNSIGNCKVLRHITANACKIRTIPASIGQCKNLEYINLGANSISEIPKEMGNLVKLKNLSIGDNIKAIPASFRNLKQMEFFDLARNQLTEFPKAVLTYHNMHNLWLHENNFSDLPQEVASLKSLSHLLIDVEELDKKDVDKVKKINPELRVIAQD